MSSHLKAELAATCSTLGRLHKGEYLIEPDCIESVKDLIRYLKRDNEAHEIRRYLGESKVLQNDLVHIIKSCSEDNFDLFDVTLRLLINLTTPTILFYDEEIPSEKIGRNIYLSLIGYSQDYKIAFCDIEFWNKICRKLTDLFEIDWSERSADDGIQIERILMLIRNVLQIPADVESEKRPENDISVHDKVLWALRQSQILELLLFISSNENEEQFYLNLLEIFSLILREQNPKTLALCNIPHSAAERNKDTEELLEIRKLEKKNRNKYINMRNFNATFVMKGMKSLSDKDIVCHKSLSKVNEMNMDNFNKKKVKAPRNCIPVESERLERRSAFSVRLFLKEFCLEFLNCSFGNLMRVVKNKLDSGKSLANDQTYYFWALRFFLDFATASNLNVDLIKDFLSSECFHFVQMNIDNAFEHLTADKKKMVDWVKRIHMILKTYRSLLETLLWMDYSKNPITRSISREIKSQIFYVVEYREMTLHVLLLYDPNKFSVSYLRDLIETTHLFLKLLEEYSKQTKLVVQKIQKKKSSKKKSKKDKQNIETPEEKWEKIKDDVYDILCCECILPEIPPFDAALEIPIDDQKGRAMKNIQKLLHEGRIKEGIGLLRSARQVWPENDHFGAEKLSVEDEVMALQEICLADLDHIDEGDDEKNVTHAEEGEDEEENENLENETYIVEKDFDIMDYKKRLANKKVVEACGILLKHYKKNSDHTNHCVIKLLHRIGWECCMPALLYQASLFWTLLKIMQDNSKDYEEINTFTVNLTRKFRKHAITNSIVFLELLFWKENRVALEIQNGYEPYKEKLKVGKRSKKNKSKALGDAEEKNGKKKGKGKEAKSFSEDSDSETEIVKLNENCEIKTKEDEGSERKAKKKRVKEQCKKSSSNLTESKEDIVNPTLKIIGSLSRVLFDNNSESEDKEMNFLNEDDSEKSSVLNFNEPRNNSSEKCHANLLEIDEKLNERNENSKKLEESSHSIVKAKAKFKGSQLRIYKSNNDESRKEGSYPNEDTVKDAKTLNSKPEVGQLYLKGSGYEEENKNESIWRKSQTENINREKLYSKVLSSKSRLKCGTDGENEAMEEMKKHKSSGDKHQVILSQEDNSCTSNVPPLKRGRKANKKVTLRSSEDADESENLKRIRYIGSDLDFGNFESEDEESTFIPNLKKRKRRLALIDSDSDVETNSLHEK